MRSQNASRTINPQRKMIRDYRSLTDSPAHLAGNVFDVGNYLQADPDPTALHLGLQRHESPERNYTPRRVTPAVVCLRLNGEAGSLPDD
jgi:hypothetical protein